jgi:hypothetical protein
MWTQICASGQDGSAGGFAAPRPVIIGRAVSDDAGWTFRTPTMAIPSSYPSLRLEGGLFSPDLIEALTTADLPGQKPPDFRLPPGRSLTGEIAAAFNDARALWQVFQNRLERLPADDPATSATREFWVIPFLRLLGYDLRFNSRALEVDGAPFPISHALGADQSQDHAGAEAPVPVHIVGCRQELGRVAPAARPRLSPHALVQEYLNRSEALWGIVTNGRTLRLLRNSTFVRRQAYVEFDLAAIFADEGRFADFVLLYRLLHRTRLPSDGRAPADCLLETYYQQAVEQGGRVRERLRDGVEQAIVILANGFLRHPASVALRATLQPQRGEESASSAHPSEAVHAEHRQRQGEGADALYRQLLRLVYRLLFLLTAEERGLMGGDPLYRDHYGVGRLRRLCTRRTAYTDHDDLWLSLRALWLVLTDERMARLLDAPPLNGELFAHQELDDASIANLDLLRAFWHLAFYREGNAPPRRVNYAALDTEELGSVYESLLDYHPAITFDTRGRPTFVLTFGSERKATGSYYTPPSLVNELVQSALAPVLEERVRPCRTAQEKEAALLALNVLDPACGSGHFLLAAARRLGKELARIRTGEDEPAPERVREAIRDVVAHCIYGVDRNPLAVELARVALWLESHAEGKPLTFLDHRIKCGDSLVGVLDLEALREGLPDDAFAPVVGDDRKLAANLKRRNRTEREGQLTLFDAPIDHDLSPLAETVRRIETIRDDTPDQVHRKRATYEAWRTDPHLRRLSNACDLWTAAFFQVLTPHPRPTAPDAPASPAQNPEQIITTDAIRRAFAGQPIAANLLGEAQALAAEHRFFHWPLEFPEVFSGGGFDVVVGNPPFSAELSRSTKKFLKITYNDSGSTNTANLFWFRALKLIKFGGRIGLVTPKSITYSTRWNKTRLALLPYLKEIIDCGEAWKNILLEQVLIVVAKDDNNQDVKTKRLYHNTHEVVYITRQILGIFDVWFVSPETGLIEILNRVQKFPQDWISLGKIIVTHRGDGCQREVRNQGDFPVIGGKDIGSFKVRSVSGFVMSHHIGDFDKFKSPKAIFQNIVAYVLRPKPHIKIIGTVDYDGLICLDTINIVRCPTGVFSPETIVAILSSKFINWLIHRIVFGFAQRTMHLDQFAFDRVFIPVDLLKVNQDLDILAKRLLQSEGTDQDAIHSIEEIIQNAYRVEPALRKEIATYFENFPQ